jgi:hypothetical protein
LVSIQILIDTRDLSGLYLPYHIQQLHPYTLSNQFLYLQTVDGLIEEINFNCGGNGDEDSKHEVDISIKRQHFDVHGTFAIITRHSSASKINRIAAIVHDIETS